MLDDNENTRPSFADLEMLVEKYRNQIITGAPFF
jgi:hypothetical protein